MTLTPPIQTLFAMPLFEDVARGTNSYTMSLYWPLTVALTLVVFLCWYLWVRHKNNADLQFEEHV